MRCIFSNNLACLFTYFFVELQGLMKHHQEIAEYFHQRGVSAIFLLRRNLLQRYVSILANDLDRNTKQLNGTHKAHVHHRVQVHIFFLDTPECDNFLFCGCKIWYHKATMNPLNHTIPLTTLLAILLQNNRKSICFHCRQMFLLSISQQSTQNH